MPLRLVFMGTPEFAVPTLAALVAGGHEVAAAYTRAPRPAGRGLAARATPVASEAERSGLAVLTPKTLRDPGILAAIRDHGADAAVVVAYGLILPKPVLETFPLGCFNLHASLLPRWRGAAPIHRAVMAGDRETGVTVMKMEEGLDTGPIALTERVAIGPDMTTGDLHDTLARRGADLMLRALAELEHGALRWTPQPVADATYADKIENRETRIDWRNTWQQVHNQCRGLSPWPGAWFELSGAGRIKVLRTTKGEGEGAPGAVLDNDFTIACGHGAVRILELQRAGGKAMAAADFLRGAPVPRTSLAR